MNDVLCPKYGSEQVTANQKGFSVKKADFKKKTSNSDYLVFAVAFIIIVIFAKCGSGGRTYKPEEQAKINRMKDSIMKSYDNTNKSGNANIIQSDFVNKKIEEFKSQINSGASADEIKQKQELLTKSFLKENKNKLIDWSGKIISVDMFQDIELDISITILDREIVGQKTISSKTMDCGITIDADQATSKKYGYKGVVRKGEIYEKIKDLKEGDNVIFSAEVIDATDNTEKTGLNLSTLLHLKIIDIRKKEIFY